MKNLLLSLTVIITSAQICASAPQQESKRAAWIEEVRRQTTEVADAFKEKKHAITIQKLAKRVRRMEAQQRAIEGFRHRILALEFDPPHVKTLLLQAIRNYQDKPTMLAKGYIKAADEKIKAHEEVQAQKSDENSSASSFAVEVEPASKSDETASEVSFSVSDASASDNEFTLSADESSELGNVTHHSERGTHFSDLVPDSSATAAPFQFPNPDEIDTAKLKLQFEGFNIRIAHREKEIRKRIRDRKALFGSISEEAISNPVALHQLEIRDRIELMICTNWQKLNKILVSDDAKYRQEEIVFLENQLAKLKSHLLEMQQLRILRALSH